MTSINDLPDVDEEVPVISEKDRLALMRRWSVTVAGILLVHSPFLLSIASRMWQRDHYQFFPLLLGGIIWIVFQRIPKIEWPIVQCFSLRHFIYLSLTATLFTLAFWTQSDFLAQASCLLALWTSVWYFGGVSASYLMRGPLILMISLIPIPFRFDLHMVVKLQHLASQLASRALDIAGISHTLSGVVIQTFSKTYMVEEACSGIHSLFSAVSVMLFFSVCRGYGLPRILCAVSITGFWVVMANALRVFAIVYFAERFNQPLDQGLSHEVLGILTYTLGLLLAISTDQLLLFLFPFQMGHLTEVQLEFIERVTLPWNAAVHGQIDARCLKGRAASIVPVAISTMLLVLVGGYAALHRQPQETKAAATASLPELYDAEFFNGNIDVNSLPETVSGWTRTSFEELKRNRDDLFAARSAVWSYEGHGMQVLFSLDGFYNSWHDLSLCYRGIGWQLEQAKNDHTSGVDKPVPHTQLNLHKGGSDYAVVLFGCFDANLEPVEPPDVAVGVLEAITIRIQQMRAGASDIPKARKQPLIQFQLKIESGHELQGFEMDALKTLFADLRNLILAAGRESR